jgi:hypothetical protein
MMVNRQSSDTVPAPPPIAKRKRRASCLGEQERRERKRAIDREAQRSLREKTKTHIAELEHTIQILRDQDGNKATKLLLEEIEGLRSENERLRDIIESVKGVVGNIEVPVERSKRAKETVDEPVATSVGTHMSLLDLDFDTAMEWLTPDGSRS